MDTSTLSLSKLPTADDRIHAFALPKTSLVQSDAPQPAEDWFTRLISPLTHNSFSAPSSASPSLAPDPTMQDPTHFQIQVSCSEGSLRSRQLQQPFPHRPDLPSSNQPGNDTSGNGGQGFSTLLLIFIPIMVVVLTVLIGIVVFLVVVLYMRRRKGIRLTEDGGPLDLSKTDGVMGEGGVDGVEMRWLETVEPEVREGYKRAKEWQQQYPPTSVPTDITLSQFLSIQEKGVSAWSFEPDYEDNLSLYVQSRTEITFLADGPGMPAREGGGNSVMANLPLPKLNEVYYWECKMYEKAVNTEISIGLATKPYPSFRLPGWNRNSIGYFASDGFKSHNYPFTAASYGAPLAEGDVLGVGYRPRTGTVFFTRNGRKMDDAYTGLQRFNLFPTIGANGPCTIHVNLGQAGFVFIEANVKKWGLAPMVGTLAPPPAYGSERGSILLDAGYGTPGANQTSLGGMSALLEAARNRSGQLASSLASASSSIRPQASAIPSPPRSSNSSRRHRHAGKAATLSTSRDLGSSVPANPSPLRTSRQGDTSGAGPGPTTAGSRRRALGRGGQEDITYVSPTDTPVIGPRIPSPDALEYVVSEDEDGDGSEYDSANDDDDDGASSTMEPNPPTPNLLDISLHSLRNGRNHFFGGRERDAARYESLRVEENEREGDDDGSGGSDETARPARPTMAPGGQGTRPSPPPPGYAPLDPNVYSSGLPNDLPEELINQAIAAMSGEPTPQAQTPAETPSATAVEGRAGRLSGWLFGRRED